MLLRWAEKIVDAFFAVVPRPKPCCERAQQTLLIAHRGVPTQGINENTLAAFQNAQELGCWGIEFDVHRTADGVFVVNHDPDLYRLWGHDATIAQLSFAELRRVVPEIPSLAEVVARYGTVLHLLIELKIPLADESAFLQALHPCIPVKDYHLLTLNASYFSSLTHCPKQTLLLVAAHNNVAEFCDLSLKEQYGGVLGNYLLLGKRQRHRLAAARQIFGVGQINSKYSLYRELNRNTRWIFTNQASTLTACLKSLR